jgi:drug/metabolite transporter (DMT)-like permease
LGEAVTFALVASFFTATSSVCQRLGARQADTGGRFSAKLILDLLGQPLWLAGVGSMILGFVFQLVALDFGSLALVQPILATELLFVFAYMAILGSRQLVRADWVACTAMALGLGVFLFVANPSGGRVHTSGESWWLAGLAAGGTTLILTVGVYLPRRKGSTPSPARRAATLGVAAGVAWGFVAAVIKELSSHISEGAGAVFSNWSPYVLIVVGAGSMLVAIHALEAGPLPASQPGFTIADPLVASLLGVFIFREHLRLAPGHLVVEVLALTSIVAGVVALSHSQLIRPDSTDSSQDESPPADSSPPEGDRQPVQSGLLERGEG